MIDETAQRSTASGGRCLGGALDRVGGAHLGARRLLAVHADDRHGLHAAVAINVFEMDHRLAAMGVALAARLHAGLAADAAIGVDEEVQVGGFHFKASYEMRRGCAIGMRKESGHFIR